MKSHLSSKFCGGRRSTRIQLREGPVTGIVQSQILQFREWVGSLSSSPQGSYQHAAGDRSHVSLQVRAYIPWVQGDRHNAFGSVPPVEL